MKTAKQPENELEEIKDIILNKICTEAMLKKHDDVAEIIKKVVPKLNNKNTQLEWGKEVTDFSSAVKEKARVFLFIQTKFPDWFKVDRKILEEKISEGVGIQTSFSRSKYPIDENMLEMKNLGIETVIVPGLPSINISKEGITLYYVDDPLSTQPESRVAISIEGKIGRKLSKSLYPRYIMKFTNSEYHKLLPSIENKMREAMNKIRHNRDEIEILHNLIYDKSLENSERIFLSVFFFQLDNDEYIPIKKIAKDTQLECLQIQNEIMRFVKKGVVLEYEPAVGAHTGKVRLTGKGMSSYVPRVLFGILQDKKWHNDIKLQDIQFRYGLTVKRVLESVEPLTKKVPY